MKNTPQPLQQMGTIKLVSHISNKPIPEGPLYRDESGKLFFTDDLHPLQDYMRSQSYHEYKHV